MKKMLSIMLILILVLTLSGCDSDNPLEQARAFFFGGEDDTNGTTSKKYYNYDDYTSSSYYDYDDYTSSSYSDYTSSSYYNSYTSTDPWDSVFEEYAALLGQYYSYSQAGIDVSGIEAQIGALDTELDEMYEGLSESDKTRFGEDASQFISEMETTYGYSF